jgi:hypothetical protein
METCLSLQAHILIFCDIKILIVGQAPGIKVHESGIPWNDASGDRLREWLDVTKKTIYSMKIFQLGRWGSVIREKVNQVICLPVANKRKHGWL